MQAEVKTWLSFIPSTLLFACYWFSRRFYKYIIEEPSTDESLRFIWKPHSSVEKHILLDKKIFKKANRVKWIQAKQLSFIYFLFCYYSLIYFILYYFIFSPSTFSSMHVRTMRTGSYAPAKVLFIKITSVLMSNLIYWLFALHSAKALDITQLIRKLRRGLRRPAFHFWLSNSERGVGSSNFRLST